MPAIQIDLCRFRCAMLASVYNILCEAYFFSTWREFSSVARQEQPELFNDYFADLRFVNEEKLSTPSERRNARKRLKAQFESNKFFVQTAGSHLSLFYVPPRNANEPNDSTGNMLRASVEKCLKDGADLPFDRMRRVVRLHGSFSALILWCSLLRLCLRRSHSFCPFCRDDWSVERLP